MYKIECDDNIIFYEIQRASIKNIYIRIRDNKVIVRAPKRVNEDYIKNLVEQKSNWIQDNLQKSIKRQKEENEINQQKIEELRQTVQIAINYYSEKMQLQPRVCRIRDISYAWGTCSRNNNITISMKLATKSKEAVEYVVVHELSHSCYKNHSKQFWNLVEKYIPNYKQIRKELRG